MKTREWNQKVSIVVSFCVLFIIIVSFLYVSNHLVHNCSQSQCPVCEQMKQCMRVVGGFASIVVVLLFLYRRMPDLFPCGGISLQEFIAATLVEQKVRMND